MTTDEYEESSDAQWVYANMEHAQEWSRAITWAIWSTCKFTFILMYQVPGIINTAAIMQGYITEQSVQTLSKLGSVAIPKYNYNFVQLLIPKDLSSSGHCD